MFRQQFLDSINAQIRDLDKINLIIYEHELKKELDHIFFGIMRDKINEIWLKLIQLQDDEEFVPFGQTFIVRKKILN